MPGAAQNSAPLGRHADYSARKTSSDADTVPPTKRLVRRAPTPSCDCLGGWQRDKHSAAAPHRRQPRPGRALTRCRSEYPSVRWPAKLRRCGSRSKSTDKTDTSFGIGRRPFHRDGVLAKWQLGMRPGNTSCVIKPAATYAEAAARFHSPAASVDA